MTSAAMGDDDPMAGAMCVECEDTEAAVRCEDCRDVYCALCFEAQHHAGTRLRHRQTPLSAHDGTSAASPSLRPRQLRPRPHRGLALRKDAAYIPLRLTEDERALFTLLDASLNVSEYTDKVDVLSYRSPVKRIIQELKEVFSTLSGMMVATDFRKGKRLVLNTKFEENEEFFRRVFEIGRRYKIMNPERMRDNYGKMIYLLQDANMREIRNHMGFSCVGPIKTIETFLTERHALDLLNDPRVLNCHRCDYEIA
ncbi:hypothetical protein PINS_up019703 [Pythium insidiosum]|nr:hypothetical protein PINS_up019703 [Pythium insidiosum]